MTYISALTNERTTEYTWANLANVYIPVDNSTSGNSEKIKGQNLATVFAEAFPIKGPSNVSNTAGGTKATAVGAYNTASGTYSTAFGYSNTASSTYATAVGYDNTASTSSGCVAMGNNNSATAQNCVAVGVGNVASADYSTAVGVSCTSSASKVSTFGRAVKSTITETCEIGYWAGASTRTSSVRMHNNGQVAVTLQNSATAPSDGGATAGSEAAGTLPRECYSIRRDGTDVYIDINVAGTITSYKINNIEPL